MKLDEGRLVNSYLTCSCSTHREFWMIYLDKQDITILINMGLKWSNSNLYKINKFCRMNLARNFGGFALKGPERGQTFSKSFHPLRHMVKMRICGFQNKICVPTFDIYIFLSTLYFRVESSWINAKTIFVCIGEFVLIEANFFYAIFFIYKIMLIVFSETYSHILFISVP